MTWLVLGANGQLGQELIHLLKSKNIEVIGTDRNEIDFVKPNEIAEKIINREILNRDPFVVKSEKWELAIPLNPVHVSGTNWVLEVFTVFRESRENPFRVGKDQIVIWV